MAESGSKRIDRRDLKGPDEFVVTVGRLMSWGRRHQRTLTLGVGAVAVLVAVVTLLGWNSARRTQQAAERFRQAYSAFQNEDYGVAAAEFESLATGYARTSFGKLAALYRGHSLRADGDADAAAISYRIFVDSGAGSDDLRQAALFALGQLREDTASTGEAIDLYRQAAALDGPYQQEASLGAARLMTAVGRDGEARALYTTLLESADGELKALVEAKLAALPAAS